jgi:PAS domain S-box-containing protein
MTNLFSKNEHNRRAIDRIPLQLPIYLFLQNGTGKKFTAMSVNLHNRGAEIRTNTKVTRGSSVHIRLPQAVAGRQTSTTPGKVRWTSNKKGEHSYGISFKEDFRWVFSLTKETLPVLKINNTPSVAEFVLNSISDGVFSVNRQWQLTSFNRAAEKITGWQREEVIGRNCQDVFNGGSCGDCILAESIRLGRPIIDKTLYISTAQGKRLLVKINTTPLVGSDGKITGGVQVFRHISDTKGEKVILDSVATLPHNTLPAVSIQTLGVFCLKINGQPLYDRVWKGRRSKELLKTIIALGGTKVSMEKLSSLLWPDSDGDRALNNLKMALSRLRRIGGDEYAMPSNWLAVKQQQVSLVRSVCRVDALEFGRKLEEIDDMDNEQSLRRVLTLYTNDFLPQDETPWINPFRDHLRTLFVKGVLHFASLKGTEDEVLLALLEQARHSAPLHEGVYSCLMKHYLKAGFPATALHIYHKAEKIISLRTGIAPGVVLQSLARKAHKANRIR